MTSSSRRITRRSDVLLTRTGGEALLIDERGGNVHVVNHTAARVWELCEGEPTLEQLSDSLAREYDVAGDVVRGDVETMIGTFSELGLLEIGTAG